jgi:lipopolysaccharide export system protein LptA
MKRKIILLLVGLAVTFSAYFAYQAVSGTVEDYDRSLPDPNDMVVPPDGTQMNTAAGTGFLYVRNDPETNRREFTLAGRQWEKRDDDSFHFTDPNVQIYLANGGRLQVLADEGVAYVREVGNTFEPRHGRLTGNVRIFYFRRPSERISSRPEANVVRIFTDDLAFDNEMLLLSTDSRITLWSREADLLGTGLTLRWNEGPGELDVLRIEEGQYMSVYAMPGGMDALGLGDGSGGADDKDRAAAEQTATRPDTPTEPDTASGEPATQPAGENRQRPAMNKYAATFNKDVRVIAQDGSATGIDSLSLMFEWQADLDEGQTAGRPGRQRRPRQARPPEPNAPATQPADGETSQPLSIYWSGPLEVVPTGYTESPSSKRWAIHGKGPRVRLDSEDYRAICRGFSYVSDPNKQIGRLEGTKDEPVRLALATGERASAPVVLFDRLSGDPNTSKVFLVGPGRMSRPTEGRPAEPMLLDLEAAALDANAAERITWSEEVEAIFHRPSDPNDQPHLISATFTGDVDFRRAADRTDIRCDWLEVTTGQIERTDANSGKRETKTYPKQIVARANKGGGGLRASQSGSRIDANEIELTFAPPRPDADPNSDAARARPAMVNATGNVRLEGGSGGEDDPMVAICQTLTSNLLDGSATLRGKPAKIRQDANQLTGETIYLERKEAREGGYHERLEVRGAGAMTFRTDRDLEGNALEQSRLVNVAWARQMKFIGADDQATFNGEVRLRSQQEEMDCETMVVEFDRVEPNVPRGGKPAPDANAPAVLEMGSGSFAKRRIREVIATGNVRLLSKREDPNSRMLWRFALVTPRQLTFDANARTMQVTGEGKLALEDYRRPQRRKKSATSEDAYLVSPSQTVFDWNKSMSLSQDDLTVIMEGDVGAVHRSGKKVVLTKGLKVPFEMASAPPGRETILGCGWMTATFSREADPNDADEPKEDGRAGVFGLSGRLDRFVAKRGVTLRDGRARVEDCGLLKYDRVEDLVVLDGPGRGNVYLRYRSRDGGLQQKSASRIIWRPDKGIARATDVSGTGARPAEE